MTPISMNYNFNGQNKRQQNSQIFLFPTFRMYHKNHHFTILRELDVIEKKKEHEWKLPRYANVS